MTLRKKQNNLKLFNVINQVTLSYVLHRKKHSVIITISEAKDLLSHDRKGKLSPSFTVHHSLFIIHCSSITVCHPRNIKAITIISEKLRVSYIANI